MIFICNFFISGCITTKIMQPSEKSIQPAMEITLPDRIFVNNETTPIDIKMVCAAILNKLRHRSETEFVRFDPGVGQKVQEKTFKYEDFDVILIDITGFEAKILAKNQVQGILEGVFHFEDFVGRRASTYFAAKYLKTPDGIVINKAGITIIPPVFPRLEAYFIPVEAFNEIQKNKVQGFLELYAFALGNSLDMNPSKEETQAYQAYQNLSIWKKATAKKMGEMELAVMIFCFDRLSNDARFEVIVSGSGSKDLVEPEYINKNGWPIAVLGGEFVPDSWGSIFDINAYYTPEGKNEKLLIGKFSNKKNYNPKQKQPRMKNYLKQEVSSKQPSIDDQKEGPVESGVIFLDPRHKGDARLIQTRLMDLGYYKKKIDGDFGRGSKNALKNFRKDSGLEDNSTWDLRTQKILFKNSGL